MKFSGEFTNWLESGVPENTGMVTASLSCSCSAAVDAELAQDIQLWHKAKHCKVILLSKQPIGNPCN